MKLKKIGHYLCLGIIILGVMVGCGNKPTELQEKKEEEVKGNCTVEECINQIEPKMKVEEVNQIIGFEGEKKADSDSYIWQLTTKTKIEVEYKDNLGSIKATYDKDKINSNELKMSIGYEIVNDIKKKTYTYEEMVEKFEGVEGHLESKSSTSKMYIWVKDGQTFRATFSDSLKGKCSIVSIR